MKRMLLCGCAFVFSLVICAQQTRILFLGNSYTYVNDLPGTIGQLALSLGDSVYYESNTPGGYTLFQHTTNPSSLAKLATPGWDYVVIQAQSQEPSLDSATFFYQTYPYAKKLDSLVHITNPCAITLFYMTWGRKYGDSYWCPVNPPSCTFPSMNDKLRERYLLMAADNDAQVARVGMAWKNSWFGDSTINLWSGDNSHPSIEGTYLTANVFYASIFKVSTVGSGFTNGIDPVKANYLRMIASNTVLDSIDTWMLNQPPIHASFIDTINQNFFEGYSTSHHATSWWWDFGDGTGHSSLENSNYYYPSTGTYNVQLVAYNQCYSDTAFALIDINSIGIDDQLGEAEWNIFPNPATDVVYLKGVLWNKSYEIYDATGRIAKSGIVNSNYLNISDLTVGNYVLKIENKTKKIIKE